MEGEHHTKYGVEPSAVRCRRLGLDPTLHGLAPGREVGTWGLAPSGVRPQALKGQKQEEDEGIQGEKKMELNVEKSLVIYLSLVKFYKL